MWRGTTQTQDDPAIQGGVDYADDSGFYVGTWASNIDWGSSKPNYELDFYGGYGGEVGEFGYDVSAIYYAYPDADGDADFAEIGLSGSWRMLSAGISYTVWGEVKAGPFNDGDLYYYGSFELPLPQDFGIGGTLGYYNFDQGENYTHWGIYLSKDVGDFGSFSLNYDQNDGGKDNGYDDDPKIWVGWSKEF
jgi:uncharacterized protein (TIGR02001 family)